MNNYNNIKDKIISGNETIISALKKMDEVKSKLLFVFDGEGKFDCIVTIGDIQRAIIKNVTMLAPIADILDRKKIYAHISDGIDYVKKVMFSERIECMPILDDKNELVDVLFWNDVFSESAIETRPQINLPVVIMAGGKGTRLRPITNIIPKPLVPIGEKTILESILNQFEIIGCNNFYMSVNYKSDMIRFYLDNLPRKYSIELFEESKPLGTIGSVSLLKGKIDSPFFVSNCDILIDQDYRDVYEYHLQNSNDLTIVAAIKNTIIPYGVIETGNDGLMLNLKEKPENTYLINTGVYLLNPGLIDEIPQGQFYHITDLIEKVRERKGRVGCFPVSENSWHDMGEWPEYLKMINVL